MGNYFKPWQRKFGLAVLAIACVSVFGWLRSESTQDSFAISFLRTTQHRLISASGHLIVVTIKIEGENSVPVQFWMSKKATVGQFDLVFQLPNSTRAILQNAIANKICATGNAEMGANFHQFDAKWIQVPYWLASVPLAVLSAWLLLFTNRRTKETDSTKKPAS